jgi:phosphatidylserine synthase
MSMPNLGEVAVEAGLVGVVAAAGAYMFDPTDGKGALTTAFGTWSFPVSTGVATAVASGVSDLALGPLARMAVAGTGAGELTENLIDPISTGVASALVLGFSGEQFTWFGMNNLKAFALGAGSKMAGSWMGERVVLPMLNM